MASRLWWRTLLDDGWGGAVRIVRVDGGVGREKSLLTCPTPTRRRLWVPPFLPEGCHVYLSLITFVPGETLGLVRAAAASSSFSLLKVLLRMRRFGLRGRQWYFSGGRNGCELFSYSSLSRSRHLFLLSFFVFFVWAYVCCDPSMLVVSWLLY